MNLKRILSLVSETVVRATQTEGVSIYLKDDDRNEILRRAIALQTPPAPGFLTPDLAPATMVTALRRTNDVIVTEELSRPGCDNATRALHDDLAALNWTLVLPVLSEGTVIGAIVLGPKLSGDPFYPQDFDLLMTLANQAGIAIKNAQLYAEVVLANEYIENIIATAKSGVVAVNASGRITMFNPAAETLTGLPRAAAIGQDASAMLPAPLAAMLAISVQSGQAVTEPEIELSGGGTMRPVICTTSPLRDETAAMLGAVAVFSDLTPLKELEVERRRAERLAYLETLASALAHEIKNPLVSIKTFAQLIPRRRDDDEFIQRFSRIAAREIGQMERLLERLRTLARPSERRHHPVDLRLPLREALETMQPIYDEKSVALLVELGDDPFTVRGDHDELKQLFHNLLINAHEATPPAGTVTVRLKGSPDSGVVTVADSGAGIAPELLERVFEPFFTTKQRGTGLGLAICASIAAAHRARLRAANGPGGGAQFTIEFARTVAVPAPTPA